MSGPDSEVVDTSLDPLVDEPPGEGAPETDQTVPAPAESYGNQGAYEPAEVLWSSVRTAERKLADATADQVVAIEEVRAARLRRKELFHRRRGLTREDRLAAAALEQAEVVLQERAIAAFVSNDVAVGAVSAVADSLQAVEHDEILDLQARRVLLDVAIDQDEIAIAEVVRLREQLDRSIVDVVDALRAAKTEIAQGEDRALEAAEVVTKATDELQAFQAGSAIYISGVVFPVDTPDLPLIDSYGFPRMPGTPDEHWHEGIDIFAPVGTPLVAAERGVITRISTGRLGGLTLWLRGESGADWYYAHLLSYAPGLAEGQVVEAGDLVGHVGNTGNAATTPAHLHLQLHPGGGDPVNPYPLLNTIAESSAETQ